MVESGAERALTRCVGWLAGRRLPRLAGNLTTSSNLDRGERISGLFLGITCITSTSCELGKSNGRADPWQVGWSFVLTMSLVNQF